MKKKINVFVAEDHDFFRKGIIIALNDISFVKVVGEARNGQELIEKLKTTSVDIVLTDIKMPVMDGIKATEIIKTLYPAVKIIAISLYGDEMYLEKMIKAGVHGFILKNTTTKDLERALNFVKEDKQYFSEEFLPYFTKKYVSDKSTNTEIKLTKRELEILQYISQGLTSKEIAKELNISIKTASNHRTNILSKTGAKNTASLVGYAYKNKLID